MKAIKSFAKQVFLRCGFEVRRREVDAFSFAKLDTLCANEFISFFLSRAVGDVIIIGAHDLISHDDIADVLQNIKTGRIFAFEPRPDYYELLIENAKKLKIELTPINEAVAPTDGDIKIYEIDKSKLGLYPEWANGIASSSLDHVLKIASREHVVSAVYKSSSPDSWFSRFEIQKIKYLQIDAEGYDYEILRSVNLMLHQPSIIKFEFVNLSTTEKKEVVMALTGLYDLFFDGENLIAINFKDLLK